MNRLRWWLLQSPSLSVQRDLGYSFASMGWVGTQGSVPLTPKPRSPFPTPQGCDEVANQMEDPFHLIPCDDIVNTYYRDIDRWVCTPLASLHLTAPWDSCDS